MRSLTLAAVAAALVVVGCGPEVIGPRNSEIPGPARERVARCRGARSGSQWKDGGAGGGKHSGLGAGGAGARAGHGGGAVVGHRDRARFGATRPGGRKSYTVLVAGSRRR